MKPELDGLPEPLKRLFKTYLIVESVNLPSLKRYLDSANGHDERRLFYHQLNDAIANRTMSPETYEALTGEDFDSQQELLEWLASVRDALFPAGL